MIVVVGAGVALAFWLLIAAMDLFPRLTCCIFGAGFLLLIHGVVRSEPNFRIVEWIIWGVIATWIASAIHQSQPKVKAANEAKKKAEQEARIDLLMAEREAKHKA